MSDYASLDELARFKRGYDLPTHDRRPGTTPILGSFGVTGWHDEAKANGPGVTIGRSGASIGVATYCDKPYWPLNTTLYVEDFKENNPRFVYFVLDSIDFRPLNSGAAQPSLNRNYLGAISVWLPDYRTQEIVANLLGVFDDLIEHNQRRIEILEESARLLYREWFVRFRFPGHERAEFVDSELGLIPDGWKLVTATEAIEVNPKLKIGKNLECRFLSMSDLSEASMVCFPSERRRASSGSKFQNGDTLFARITPCLENGKIGFIQCLSDGEIGRGSTEFIVLRSRRLCPEMTYLLARDERFRQNAIKSMSGASGRQRVRPECFDSFVLAEPPSALIERFAQLTSPMFNLIAVLAEENGVLRTARDLLLPRLVSGELDVSELDLDLEAMGV